MRKLALLSMSSMRSMMAALLSMPVIGSPITIRRPNIAPGAGRKSRKRRFVSNRTTTFFEPNGQRERERRIRQGAHFLQLHSHKPGSVQPRHIFGDAS